MIAKRTSAVFPTVLVTEEDIVAKPSDNPRFRLEGRTPEQAAAAHYASDEFKALCRSLDETGGPRVPLQVEDTGNGKYNLIDGWSRLEWLRKKNAKRKRPIKVTACIIPVNDDKHRRTLRVQINTARHKYEPIAQARACAELVTLWGDVNIAAKHIGISVAQVKKRLDLLMLPSGIQRLISDGRITLLGAEQLQELPGYGAYIKFRNWETQDGPEPEDTDVERAQVIEDFMKQVVATIENSERATKFSHSDISGMWNGKKHPKNKKNRKAKDAPSIDPDDIISSAPSDKAVHDTCKQIGLLIASETQKHRPSKKNIDQWTLMIESVGYVMGWCTPAPMLSVAVDRDGNPTMSEEAARITCMYTVASHVCEALHEDMEEHGYKIEDDSPLLDEAAWETFVKRDIPIAQKIGELIEHYTAA